MGEPALKNPFGLHVGQKLILIRHKEAEEAEVTKIGRQWATLAYGRWGETGRVSLDDLSTHDSDKLYGRVYLSQEHRSESEAAERARAHLAKCWKAFCEKVYHWRVPDGLTFEALETAAKALGIELPPAPSPQGETG